MPSYKDGELMLNALSRIKIEKNHHNEVTQHRAEEYNGNLIHLTEKQII